MEAPSDAVLIARSLSEPEAFGALYDRHSGDLLGFFARRLGREPAEGLLGELFRVAFEHRERFDCTRDSARPWLFGIASNLLLKHRRSEARRLRACARLAAESLHGHRSRELPAETRTALSGLAEEVVELPEAERDALLLYAWEDLSYDEVSDALDVPIGTVRSRIHRARSRLRERIGVGGEVASDAGGRRDSRRPR